MDSAPLVILGFVGVGAMNGAVLLARTAAADMYPEEKKARAISYVLFGALFGAALGPLVFRPLFAGKDLELDTLVIPWFAAAAMCVVGLCIALLDSARPAHDRARARSAPGSRQASRTRPSLQLRSGEILRRPGVPSAVLAALASFAVMAGVMNLTGYIVVGHQHEQADVFTRHQPPHRRDVRAGPRRRRSSSTGSGGSRALIAGLAIMAVSTVMLAWVVSIPAMSLSLFLLGLGWNVSYVAASAELVTHATPVERGRLVGFTDLVAGLLPQRSRSWAGSRTRSGVSPRSRSAPPSLWSSRRLPCFVARRPPAAAPEPAA